jgi:hypothetical protein
MTQYKIKYYAYVHPGEQLDIVNALLYQQYNIIWDESAPFHDTEKGIQIEERRYVVFTHDVPEV